MPIIKQKPVRTQGFLEQLIERLTKKCKQCLSTYNTDLPLGDYSAITSVQIDKLKITPDVPYTSLEELNAAVSKVICCGPYCVCDELFTYADGVLSVESVPYVLVTIT